jgi:ribosomal protein L29
MASENSSSTSQIAAEIAELRRELLRLEETEQELKASLTEARRQLSHYRALISSMKRSMAPADLKKLLRSL